MRQGLKTRIAENWRNGAKGAGMAVLLGWAFLMLPVGDGRTLGDSLKNWSYDVLVRFRPVTTVNEAVVVLMDDASRKALGQSPDRPWHRALHATLVEELTRQKARVVVFDILWDEPWKETEVEDQSLAAALATNRLLCPVEIVPGKAAQQLATAMRAHGKVVVASSVKSVFQAGLSELTQIDPPLEPIASAAAGSGIVGLSASSDGRIRVPKYHRTLQFTNLCWKAAEVAGQELPADPWAWRWINYYGPEGALPHFSFDQVLATNGTPPDAFADKVVFVGRGRIIDAKGSRGDIIDTTMGEMPGVEIQATAFLNLWRHEYLTEPSPWTEVFWLLILGAFFGFSFVAVRPWIAAVLAILSFALVLAAAMHLAWHKFLWTPWLIPGAVQMPVALGWAVLANTRKVYREKEVLEHTLATAHLEPVQLASARGESAGEGRTIVGPPTPGPRVLPKVMADHELVRFIGGGAYGEVWLARNVIGLYRAFKIIRREKFRDDAPFQREFRGLQKFMPVSAGHPGMVQILHVGKNDPEGFFFYIMEPGDDETTGQKIDPATYSPKSFATLVRARGRLPVQEAIDLIVPLCDALDYLHGQSLIHRDIKPANVIFVKGLPKLADIGLVTEAAVQDRDVSWVGTDGYIPPEGPGSPAADVYSLGKVLYVITQGADPRNWPALSETVLEGSQQPEILALNPILLKACAGPRERYKSAGDMRADLLRVRGQIADSDSVPTRK